MATPEVQDDHESNSNFNSQDSLNDILDVRLDWPTLLVDKNLPNEA